MISAVHAAATEEGLMPGVQVTELTHMWWRTDGRSTIPIVSRLFLSLFRSNHPELLESIWTWWLTDVNRGIKKLLWTLSCTWDNSVCISSSFIVVSWQSRPLTNAASQDLLTQIRWCYQRWLNSLGSANEEKKNHICVFEESLLSI